MSFFLVLVRVGLFFIDYQKELMKHKELADKSWQIDEIKITYPSTSQNAGSYN